LGDTRAPVIVGPTAIGKTAVALALAAHLPVEVISADSRQIYRRLDVGTAKPTRRERQRVTHHGLDLVDPGERYSAGRFAREAVGWIGEVRVREHLPIVVGGTGLYIRALAEGLFVEPRLDPERRRALEHWVGGLAAPDLVRWAGRLDPGFAGGGQFRTRRAYDTTIETTIYCAPEATGRGIGTLLYRALFEALEGEDLRVAIAGTTLPNDASVALHERFGFASVGVMHDVGRKFGRYWDVAWYEKRLGQ